MLVNMNINIYTYVVSRAAFGIQIWWMEMILPAMARCHGGLFDLCTQRIGEARRHVSSYFIFNITSNQTACN